MIGTQFEGYNDVLLAPEGQEDQCYDLAIRRCAVNGSHAVVSAWKPSPEELAALNEGGSVFLLCMGQTHPPILLLGARDLEHFREQMGGDVT